MPFVLWDSFKKGAFSNDDSLYLKVWFFVMFVFFSISAGKRPVYLLPLYPPLALLTAAWFYHQVTAALGRRIYFYRSLAVVAGVAGLVLFIITLVALWNHDPGWFFAPIERLLKPKIAPIWSLSGMRWRRSAGRSQLFRCCQDFFGYPSRVVCGPVNSIRS